VDGAAGRLLRANGRHQAVALGPGRHQVALDYRPPGLAAGGAASLIGLGGVAWAAALGRRAPRP
jgi:hypothetical protein